MRGSVYWIRYRRYDQIHYKLRLQQIIQQLEPLFYFNHRNEKRRFLIKKKKFKNNKKKRKRKKNVALHNNFNTKHLINARANSTSTNSCHWCWTVWGHHFWGYADSIWKFIFRRQHSKQSFLGKSSYPKKKKKKNVLIEYRIPFSNSRILNALDDRLHHEFPQFLSSLHISAIKTFRQLIML